jgi:hypothetical protein
LAGGYLVAKTSNQTAFASTADSPFHSIVNSGFAASNSLAIGRFGGQYVFGNFTAGAAIGNTRYKPVSAFVSANAKAESFNNGAAFLNYRLTVLLRLARLNAFHDLICRSPMRLPHPARSRSLRHRVQPVRSRRTSQA